MANYTGMPLYPARMSNISDNLNPSAPDLSLGQTSVTVHNQAPSIHQMGDLSILIPGLQEIETRYPAFVGSPACMGVGGDAIFGSAVAYPPTATPLPYSQVQVMPVAQLAPSGNFNRARAMTTPVSEIPVRTLPCANPAFYASAISAGHKPSAYTIADFNEPYGVRPREYENVKGHAMHPHLHLLHSIQQTERRQ